MSELVDFDQHWDFNDASGTESTFRELLPGEGGGLAGSDWHLELLTQIARTQGLQRNFDAAHSTLDDVEARLEAASPRVRTRYLLERGRVFNSSKQAADARAMFADAWATGVESGEDALAVDAAHMLGIVEDGDAAAQWNQKALELAESSSDAKARKWAGSLHNNIGWTHHGYGEFPAALEHFEKALECRHVEGTADDLRVAKWCVARAMRSLGRFEEALAIQESLLEEHQQNGSSDGYVFEELAECTLAMGQTDSVRGYFGQTYAELSQDNWLVDNEPDRIERLRMLGSVD